MSDESDTPESLRIDKWLWHARFLKSRGLASKLVSDGKMRINGERYTKPGKTVRPEDVLTFTLQDRVRIVRIIALGERRGPAPEAQALYEDMSPPPEPTSPKGSGTREKWDGNRDKPRFDPS